MLSDADARIVASDAQLPALRYLLDSEAACQLLQQQFPNLQVTEVQCDYLRYKPGTSCLATWQVTTATGPMLFFAKAYSRRCAAKFTKAIDYISPSNSDAGLVVQNSATLLVAAPFYLDRKLPNLAKLGREDGRRKIVQRLVPDCQDLHAAELTPLRYKPERRFVAKLELHGYATAALKMYSKSRYRQARRATKSLGNLVGFPTAAPIGHSDSYREVLFEWLPGKSLATLLSDHSATIEHLQRAGEVLAHLHQLQTDKLHRRPKEVELQQIIQQTAATPLQDPAFDQRLQRMAVRCCSLLANREPNHVPTHGDLHPGQVLASNQIAALIDLDNVALGDPAYDVANFAASLEYDSLIGIITAEKSHQFQNAFIASYESATGSSLNRNHLQAFVASALLRLIHQPFRHRLPVWHALQYEIADRVDHLLSECSPRPNGKIVPSGTSCKQIDVEDPYQLTTDPALPNVSAALDPRQAQHQLAELAQSTYGEQAHRLCRIRALRHKPGKRCLIAYDFENRLGQPGPTLLGKVHSKQRHEASFQLQQALWNSGFDDQSADNMSVPRPVGIVPDWHMWLQEYVPGTDGWTALRGPQQTLVAQRIADVTEKLQQSQHLVSRTHTMTDELAILETKLPLVSEQYPRLKSRIDDLLERCHQLSGRCETNNPTTIHRDYYPDQIILQNDRLFVLDHDLCCLGPRSLDIGNFCAHLLEHVLRNPQDEHTNTQATQTIVEHHLSLIGTHQRQTVYDLTTLSLARHVYISTLFPTRQFATPQILATCENRLATPTPVAQR